jgi:hypothetical protein
MAVLKSHEEDIALSIASSFNCNMSPRLEEGWCGC